ncbi:hypothetical protein QE152_g38258 [Popillia japonica]|uniref:HTH psq-type domain-containing protein n=1 Tax=Popillia japonica TaxID=7064 RepID=A0AAW1I8D6_POPJA
MCVHAWNAVLQNQYVNSLNKQVYHMELRILLIPFKYKLKERCARLKSLPKRMRSAVESVVNENSTTRGAAIKFGVDRKTLSRYSWVIGPVKTFYNQAADDHMINFPGQTITLQDIPGLVGVAFPRAFPPTNIQKGFSSTEIYPLNFPRAFPPTNIQKGFSSTEIYPLNTAIFTDDFLGSSPGANCEADNSSLLDLLDSFISSTPTNEETYALEDDIDLPGDIDRATDSAVINTYSYIAGL